MTVSCEIAYLQRNIHGRRPDSSRTQMRSRRGAESHAFARLCPHHPTVSAFATARTKRHAYSQPFTCCAWSVKLRRNASLVPVVLEPIADYRDTRSLHEPLIRPVGIPLSALLDKHGILTKRLKTADAPTRRLPFFARYVRPIHLDTHKVQHFFAMANAAPCTKAHSTPAQSA